MARPSREVSILRANQGPTKDDLIAEITCLVGAGKPVQVETVDFSDPKRPKTCLEVDFPILPINQIAAIEGNAGKPIYQMSKWWARRRSSVFRSLLLSASMKAPDDATLADKAVWDVYYANHQGNDALKRLKVADIFMGGGTTVVEASRLGMQVFGCDLNPVAWFIVKNELAAATVDRKEVEALLADIEAEVKPQIMPFYACDCPRGHRGEWTHLPTQKKMDTDFDPLALTPDERKDYSYRGPEIIYVFWAKHGPCQVTGCGHRTPLFSSPVIAVKTLTVKVWEDHVCSNCQKTFDIEVGDPRMAPGAPLILGEDEKPFARFDLRQGVVCPHCEEQQLINYGVAGSKKKLKAKKVELTLLIHPDWLRGAAGKGPDGEEFGGSATDTPDATAAWNRERARTLRVLEVRGKLPQTVVCPETGATLRTDAGSLGSQGVYTCGACGTAQRFMEAVQKTAKTAPTSPFVIQGYCPSCALDGVSYNGRFFAAMKQPAAFDAAEKEWQVRRDDDLADFWPRGEIPYGHMTHQRQPLPQHGYTHWWKMFNPRQLLVHSQLMGAVIGTKPGRYSWAVREFVLGAFQQYLRNQNMFCFWNPQRDTPEPMFSSNNYHPKATVIENAVFPDLGRGNWLSSIESLPETIDWSYDPWELVANDKVQSSLDKPLQGLLTGRSEKVSCQDAASSNATLVCQSATDLHASAASASFDLVITDPPFGDLLFYAELSDFFYVWLRVALKSHYPNIFESAHTPKSLEVIASPISDPDNPDRFYQRLLTACWREANRILKPGGILAFTFHHSEDEPWVAVLESLFEAGFYLEATYPIRSDETKGEGEFGSKTIEYDIIHVCRKRLEEPIEISWGKLRRQILEEVRRVQSLLEHHAREGLPAADQQVIRRGKALEFFSKHYGKVYVSDVETIDVRRALLGINQLIDEESNQTQDPPPSEADPMTRQFLRIFRDANEVPRDQMQKYLRGTGIAPSEFEERGWCIEKKKVYYLVQPLEQARLLYDKKRKLLHADHDQAMLLVGASFEDSGINVMDILSQAQFKPHAALASLLDWYERHGASVEIRQAATRARMLHQAWERASAEKSTAQPAQLGLFDMTGGR